GLGAGHGARAVEGLTSGRSEHRFAPVRMAVDRRDGTVTLELTECEHRLRVGLVMEPLGRSIDISGAPAFVDGGDRADIATQVDSFCRRHGLWTMATFSADATRAITGAAFPVLGAAYDQGTSTLVEVPRWARSTIAASTLRAAANAAFGARASRPVVRALG